MKDRIVAHRGNAAEFRENSVEAIQSAIDLGVRFVEFDVHISRDGEPVVTHDSNLKRMFGVNRLVMDMTSDELKGFGIATLDLAMSLVRDAGITAFVDLKPESTDRFPGAIGKVMQYVAGHVLVSWDLSVLSRAKNLFGSQIGWIVQSLKPETQRMADGCDFLFCDQRLINAPLWKAQWVAYEVGSKERAEQLAGFGVKYFETMQVRKMMGAE